MEEILGRCKMLQMYHQIYMILSSVLVGRAFLLRFPLCMSRLTALR